MWYREKSFIVDDEWSPRIVIIKEQCDHEKYLYFKELKEDLEAHFDEVLENE